MQEKFFADDRFLVSEEVEKMSPEQIRSEIERLEAEAAEERAVKNQKAG